MNARRVRRIAFVACLIMAMLGTASSVHGGDILFVDDDAPAGGDGQSWDTAYRFLMDALTRAAFPHTDIEEIRVAEGVYRPDRFESAPGGTGQRSQTFQLITGIALRGGYAGLGSTDPDQRDPDVFVSNLSGDLAGNDFGELGNRLENSLNVVTGSGVDPTAVIEGFLITGGFANGDAQHQDNTARGAGMWNLDGSPTVLDCRFHGNVAIWNAGGMYNWGASYPLVKYCEFIENVALEGSGGAMFIYNEQAPDDVGPIIEECVFEGNRAQDDGGAVRGLFGGLISMTHCEFRGNESGGGGAIKVSNLHLTLDQCSIVDNRAQGGGGLSASDCVVNLIQSEVVANVGNYSGGGVAASDCDINVRDSVIERNVANMFGGGGLILIECELTMQGTRVVGNETPAIGGAVYTAQSLILEFRDCTISDNSAHQGGGFFFEEFTPGIPTFVMDSCRLTGNVASFHGGAIHAGSVHSGAVDIDIDIDNTLISENRAMTGGFIFLRHSTMTIRDSAILNNEAASNGGAIFSEFANIVLERCRVSGNRAGLNGPARGGALFGNLIRLSCRNTLFDGNRASESGGAVSQNVYHSEFINCTFAANKAPENSAVQTDFLPIDVQNDLVNCIVWGDDSNLVSHSDSDPTRLENTLIRGGWAGSGSGNLDADPLFVDPDGPDDDPDTFEDNDFRLRAGSPAIDAGRNDLLPPDVMIDLDGQPRVLDGNYDGVPVVDMGAYEFFADCNGNGVLDESDIADMTSIDCNGNRIPDECEHPVCFDRPATIYVDPCGFIVGGLLDGRPYRGLIMGSRGDDVIVGTDGDDLIIALGGDDFICAGPGDDQINANHGDDTIDAGEGRDVVHGGGGFDTCLNGERVSGCENGSKRVLHINDIRTR